MKYDVKTLNSISPVYHGILSADDYQVGPNVDDPDAIIVRSADMHEYEVQSNLLCIGRAGAGVNNIPLDQMAEKGVVVFNSPGANANAVKELTVAGLLLASRKISQGIAWCETLAGQDDVEKKVEQGKKAFVGPELLGKTLGVVGLGAIGVQVANMGVSLGMKVLGFDPYISVDHAWKLSRSVYHATDLSELLERSDYLTLHIPLTDDTRDTVNASVLERIKPGAALLNFSRGGLVNTEDVLSALESGRLRVYVTDFPSADLIGAKNVIVTPHLGASTPESEDNCVRMVAKQIDDYLRTGSIMNACNYPNCTLGRVVMPRLCILHRNVPNVINSITQIVSGQGLNIENMVNQSRGASAYTVLDINGTPSEQLIEEMRSRPNINRVRLLMPA